MTGDRKESIEDRPPPGFSTTEKSGKEEDGNRSLQRVKEKDPDAGRRA
jgi:hypothetical protein